jgi:MATE family multidrug resistance protein
MSASAPFRPETRSALRELANLAWPVVLARIGIMTMGLTDAMSSATTQPRS